MWWEVLGDGSGRFLERGGGEAVGVRQSGWEVLEVVGVGDYVRGCKVGILKFGGQKIGTVPPRIVIPVNKSLYPLHTESRRPDSPNRLPALVIRKKPDRASKMIEQNKNKHL